MSAPRFDLDALERLAEKATPGRRSTTAKPLLEETRVYVDGIERAYLDGRKLLNQDADAEYIAACDPVTVAALVRAVKAALVLYPESPMSPFGMTSRVAEMLAALAPFASDPGEAAAEQTDLGVARDAGSVAEEDQS